MNSKQLEWGAIIALALAILGFAFWLGGINGKVNDLTADKLIEEIHRRYVPELPSGSVIAWYSKSSNIPSGWVICNGEQGTPDLRERFIMGVGDPALVDKKGGQKSYKFDIPRTEETLQPGGARIPRPERHETVEKEILPPYVTLIYLMKK